MSGTTDINEDALIGALHEYRRCSEDQARGIITAYLALAARECDEVEIVARHLAERDHGGSPRHGVEVCEGYKDEARVLLAQLAREDTERRDDGVRRDWKCKRCASGRWVAVSLDGGATRLHQCVPCGAIGNPVRDTEPESKPSSAAGAQAAELDDLHERGWTGGTEREPER